MVLGEIVKQPWTHNYLTKKKNTVFSHKAQLRTLLWGSGIVDEHNSHHNPFHKNQFDSLCVCCEINSNSDKVFTDALKQFSYKLQMHVESQRPESACIIIFQGQDREGYSRKPYTLTICLHLQ